MPYQHIIWDWNGTLVDDVDLVVEVMNTLLHEEGLPLLDRSRYRMLFDFPVVDYYRKLGFQLEADRFAELSDRFIDRYDTAAQHSQLHAHARACLETSSARGLSNSLLSATEQNALVRTVERHSLGDLLDHVIGLENHYAHGKVDRARDWFGDEEIPRENTLLVGDTTHDHEVAAELGVACVLIAHGHHARHRLEKTGSQVVDDLDEVRELLDRP